MGLSLPKAELISLFTETFLFGVYSVLIVVTMIVLLQRRGDRPLAKGLFAATIVMYLLSTTHIILILAQDVQAFISQDAGGGHPSNFDDQNNPLLVAEEYIEVVNILIADSILIWRVWVVWGRVYWVPLIPCCTYLGTVITGFLFAHSFQTTPPGDSIFQGDLLRFAPPAAVLTLLTNVMCTGLIAGRVWLMQRRIFAFTQVETRTYRSVILLILESGFIYSAAWVTILILFISDTYGLYIVFDMISQLTGIVPTIIILLSHTDLMIGTSVQERYDTTTVRFVSHTGAGGSTTMRSVVHSSAAGHMRPAARDPYDVDEDDSNTYQLEFRENTSQVALPKPQDSEGKESALA